MNCPTCGNEMELGYLAFYDPTVFASIVWQHQKPGYVRLKPPADGIKVIKPPFLGRGDRQGYICQNCKNVVFNYGG